MNTWQIAIVIIGVNLVVWSLIFIRLRGQAQQILEETWRVGDELLIPPAKASYQGWTKRFGFMRSIGRMALTNRRIIFKRPVGSDIIIPLEDTAEVSDTVHLWRLRHTTRNYLSIRLRDGTEAVFLVNDQARWIEHIRSEIDSIR